MTTDKELLGLAAKAARYKLEILEGRLCIKHGDSSCTPMWSPWNPLQFDGDALRLANKLQLCIQIGRLDGAVVVECANNSSIYEVENYRAGETSNNATRRAITRAAAEIGKEMP